ncbi:MAG: hypothetical protein ACTSVO_07685 [Candidatus Heimdallarchaeaceae archaeon]
MSLKDGDCIIFAKSKFEEVLETQKTEQADIINWKDEKLAIGQQYHDSKLAEVNEWKNNQKQSCVTWWVGVRWICIAYTFTVFGLWFAFEWTKHIIALCYAYEIFAYSFAWNWINTSLKLVWYSIVTLICMILIWVWKPLRPAHR